MLVPPQWAYFGGRVNSSACSCSRSLRAKWPPRIVTMTSRVHAWDRVLRLPIITVRSSITAIFWCTLDARSTLFLTEREVVVLDQIARVNRLVGLNPSSSALGLFFGLGLYGDRSRVAVC
ncbi:hypothetical protein OV320_8179 [Actinobacteria bacterium OV320]|nr:hypothetical protein OV320_8179 [Actinobacteria bacterium OV320]